MHKQIVLLLVFSIIELSLISLRVKAGSNESYRQTSQNSNKSYQCEFTFAQNLQNFQSPKKIFDSFYYSSQISSRHCGQNISGFMAYLDAQGIDISRARILRLSTPSNPWGLGDLVAVNSRWGKLVDSHYHQNWNFHVVALIDGLVYDFSFHSQPLILPLREYLQIMFIPKHDLAIYGPSFRVRGSGPYYTPEEAQKQLQLMEIEVYNSDSKGNFTKIIDHIDINDL